MRKVIIEKLQQIEKQENVRILHAVESGAVHGVLNLRTVILMYALFMCVRVIII